MGAESVLVATGTFAYAAAGATLPTSATSTLSGYDDLGLISEDGLVQSINQDSNEIKAWNGDTVRKVQTSHTVEYKITMLETNPDSLAAYYATDNIDESNGVVEITAASNQRGVWVATCVDGDSDIRVVIPDGEVTAHDDVSLVSGDALKYGITITAYPDANGVKAFHYIDTPTIS